MPDYDDYDDYDDYNQMAPGMGQDPFADYDYETLLAYYKQFKDKDPEMAQMLEMGLMRKKMEMEGHTGDFGSHGHVPGRGGGRNPVKITQFNEKALVEGCIFRESLNLLETLKGVVICLLIYRLLKTTVFKLFSKPFQQLLTAMIGALLLYKQFGQENCYLFINLFLYFLILKLAFFRRPSIATKGESDNDDEDSDSDDKSNSDKEDFTEKQKLQDNLQKNEKTGPKNIILPTLFLIFFQILSEKYLYPDKNWHKIRATNMIISLKLITALAETDRSNLGFLESLGFILHPACLIFGPWTSFANYRKSFNRNIYGFKSLFSVKTYFLTIICFILSYISYMLSTCVTPYIFGDPYVDQDREESMRSIFGLQLSLLKVRGKFAPDWNFAIILYAWEIAVTFRFAWYYVAFLSNAFGLLTDQIDVHASADSTEHANIFKKCWNNFKHFFSPIFSVSNPLTVEFPFCLSSILKDWNKPISRFLSEFIYRPTYYSMKERYGSLAGRSFLGLDLRNAYPLFSILTTFVISSLFHGLNVKIAVVLISISLFSYVQFNFRKALALTFDNAAIAPNCLKSDILKNLNDKYSYKVGFIFNPLFKLVFFLINYLHLIQLGYLMLKDDFEDEQPFTYLEDFKVVHVMFRSLGYCSWYIVGGLLTFWLFTR